MVTRQANVNQSEAKRCALIAYEIQDLPASTVIYRGVGKAYIQADKARVMKDTQDLQAQCVSTLESLSANRERLMKEKEAAEEDLLELSKVIQTSA